MNAVLFDTSVLVPYCVAAHPHRARALAVVAESTQSGLECWIALHSLAETFAVLSAMPLNPRLAPDQALLLIDRTFAWSPCKANILIIKADLPAMIAKSPSSGPIAQEFDFANAVFMQFLRQVGKHEYGGFVARYANNHSIGCA